MTLRGQFYVSRPGVRHLKSWLLEPRNLRPS